MPSRVVRGEINASDSLSQVSIQADLTFRALIVAVDDYGRGDARIPMLKAALFPMRPEVSEADLEGWLAELEAAGCVQRYGVDGRPYLVLTGWEKHRGGGRRAQESRYPAPTSEEAHALPRISEEMPGDPSEKREARSEGREARDGAKTAPAGAPRARSPSSRTQGKTPFPSDLSDLRSALLPWARDRDPPLTEAHVDHALETVRLWAESNDRRKASWPRTVQSAMRDGWALKGFEPPTHTPPARGDRSSLVYGSDAWRAVNEEPP